MHHVFLESSPAPDNPTWATSSVVGTQLPGTQKLMWLRLAVLSKKGLQPSLGTVFLTENCPSD